MIKQKTLVLDIETSGCVVLVWGLGKQYITKENLIEDWHILSFSAKWLGDPPSKMIYMETRSKNDKPLLSKLWELFNEADMVITQNGKNFDEPKIKARMMIMGLQPYKPFVHYDTFIENKDKEFTSHSLDYLTETFCHKYKKLKHKKFPGMSLWKECRANNPKAWLEMKKYNNHDVFSTEELYLNTRGWSTKKAPPLFRDNDVTRQCAHCGEFRLVKRGVDRTTKKQFHRMQCQSCGKWQRGIEYKRNKVVK